MKYVVVVDSNDQDEWEPKEVPIDNVCTIINAILHTAQVDYTIRPLSEIIDC